MKAKKFGRRYPWAFWFRKGKFSLIPEKDYTCMPHGMAQMVRNMAASSKYRLRVSIDIRLSGQIDVEVVGKLPPPKKAKRL